MKTPSREPSVIKRLIHPEPIEENIWNPAYDWHNPLGFTPDQIGADRGWRPILKKELKLTDGFVAVSQGDGSWYSYNKVSLCDNPKKTYRTQRPLPEIETKLVIVYQFSKGCSQGCCAPIGEYHLPYEEADVNIINWGLCCTSEYMLEKTKIGYVIFKGHRFVVMQNGKIEKPVFYDGKAEVAISLHGDFKL